MPHNTNIRFEDEIWKEGHELAAKRPKKSFTLIVNEALSEKIARELEKEDKIIKNHN